MVPFLLQARSHLPSLSHLLNSNASGREYNPSSRRWLNGSRNMALLTCFSASVRFSPLHSINGPGGFLLHCLSQYSPRRSMASYSIASGFSNDIRTTSALTRKDHEHDAAHLMEQYVRDFLDLGRAATSRFPRNPNGHPLLIHGKAICPT